IAVPSSISVPRRPYLETCPPVTPFVLLEPNMSVLGIRALPRCTGSPDPRKPAQRRNANTMEPRYACLLHRCMRAPLSTPMLLVLGRCHRKYQTYLPSILRVA